MEALPVAWRWAAEHNVELVAAISCWYLFQMPEPLTDPHAAWRMGAELIELWDCSFGGDPLEWMPCTSVRNWRTTPGSTGARSSDPLDWPFLCQGASSRGVWPAAARAAPTTPGVELPLYAAQKFHRHVHATPMPRNPCT